MKKKKLLILLIPFILIFATSCTVVKYADNQSYNTEDRITFSELDAYGQWFSIPSLGDVWRPDAGYNWRPYESGQWELTGDGWMWFSDEPFAWIVYHYGNWAYTDSYGWVWVPGYDWSPSRVQWIASNDYIGWAPLPPSHWNLPNFYDSDGDRYWMIVRARDFDNRNIYKYRVGINSLGDRGNWNSGHSPDPNFIQDRTGRYLNRIDVQRDNFRSGKRDLTRIRITNRNQNDNYTPQNNNRDNNYTPPAGRTNPIRNDNNLNRTDNGNRNSNSGNERNRNINPPQNENKPNPNTAKPDQPVNEQPLKRKDTPRTNVIRNDDENIRNKKVIEPVKKPNTVEELKKQKKEEKKLKNEGKKNEKPKEQKRKSE